MKDDELEKFVQDYKIKLELERHELLMLSADLRSRISSKGQRQEAAAKQLSHTPPWTVTDDATSGVRVPRAERNQPNVAGVAFDSAASVTPDDPAERRRKQREYRRCLDEQIAEKRRREQQDSPASWAYSYGRCEPNACQDWPLRPASPPIRCHYRRPAHVSLSPARPPTARKSEFCLADLAELRRLYSRR